MKFSLSKEVVKMAELFERSPALRKLAWGALCVCALFALPQLVLAFRWW